MAKLIWTLLLCICIPNLWAQDNAVFSTVREGSQFYAGYARNSGDKTEKFNVIELGLGRVRYGGVEPSGYNYYAGNEFVFNSRHFSVGPKVGASVSIWMFGLGSELIYYTDFYDNSFHFAPYFTFGAGMTKFNIKYHVPLYNKEYAGINQVSIGITAGLNKPKQK